MKTNLKVRRKDGGYQYIVSYKEREYSPWKQKSKQGFKTYSEAKKAGQDRERKMYEDEASGVDTSKGYTFKVVAELYLKDGEKATNTIHTYEAHLKTFSPIHDIQVHELKYKQVSEILEEYRQNNKFSSLSSKRTFGSMVMNYAIKKLKVATYNPFLDYMLRPPMIDDKAKKSALTLDDLKRLIEALPSKYKLITAFMAYSGLRISEARGLSRNAINLKTGEIQVFQQRTKPKTITPILKTKRSYRTVPFSTELRILYESYPSPLDLLFPKYISNQSLKTAYKNAGFKITAHDLRHTFATILIQKGIDFKTVAALIGDTVQIVLKTYSHVNRDMYEAAKQTIINNF